MQGDAHSTALKYNAVRLECIFRTLRVRLRHFLNDRLRDHGGHIGYFIKRDQRGRGYRTAALRHACLFYKTETRGKG